MISEAQQWDMAVGDVPQAFLNASFDPSEEDQGRTDEESREVMNYERRSKSLGDGKE